MMAERHEQKDGKTEIQILRVVTSGYEMKDQWTPYHFITSRQPLPIGHYH